MGTIKTTNIETITGSGTLTLGQSGETISVPSGVSMSVPNGGLSGQNYPGFKVSLNAAQQVSHDVATTVAFDTTVFDTDSAFDTTTNYDFTVPTGKAGKYFFTTTIHCDDDGETWERLLLYFTVNSTSFGIFDIHQSHIRNVALTGSQIFDLSDGDTVKIQVILQTSTGTTPKLIDSNRNTFSGFRIGA